jgi:hypothetical protein
VGPFAHLKIQVDDVHDFLSGPLGVPLRHMHPNGLSTRIAQQSKKVVTALDQKTLAIKYMNSIACNLKKLLDSLPGVFYAMIHDSILVVALPAVSFIEFDHPGTRAPGIGFIFNPSTRILWQTPLSRQGQVLKAR